MLELDFSKIISKTSFARGWQCQKYLWLHKNQAEQSDAVTSDGIILKKVGSPVLELCKSLFPNAVKCGENQLNESKDWAASIALSKKMISDGKKVLFHPSFFSDNCMCDIHILEKNQNDEWCAYVVKTATRISDKNLVNAAFQLFTIKNAGLTISEFKFVLINKKYKRKGDVDAHKLLKFKSVLKELETMQPTILKAVNNMHQTLKKPNAPEIKIGPYCQSPHKCGFYNQCWKKVPKNSIFELVGFPKDAMFSFWNQGIRSIDKIPNNTTLSFNQQVQKEAKKRVNKANLKAFFHHINYPVFLVDFEGYVPAIPPYNNLKAFDNIPFLFAGFVLNAPDAEPILKYHLCHPKDDERLEFCEAFIEVSKDMKTLMAYDTNTEKNVLTSLADHLPQYRDELLEIKKKMIDLSIPIRRKDFYLPEMKGFHSLKYVLPAVVPELHYDDLEITTGRMAANIYQVLKDEKNDDVIASYKKNLIAYCQRDAIALLKLFQELQKNI